MNIISKLVTSLRKIIIGYKTPQCVGVDISATSIKMVELATNSLKISNYNIKALDRSLITQNAAISDIEKVSELIMQQWDNFSHKLNNVAVAMPYGSVIIKEIIAPIFKSKFDLDEYLQSQLVKDLGIEEIDFDYSVIEKSEENQKLSVVVAKKEKIDEYQAMIQMTGIDVAAIDVEPFAIQHLFKILLNENGIRKDVLIFDIGVNRVRAYLFSKCESVYFTEITTSYDQYFEDFLSEYKISIDSNKDVGTRAFELFAEHNVQSSNIIDAISMDISKLIQIVKSSILVEKKLTIASDHNIYLMGGNSLVPGLRDKISEINEVVVRYSDELLHPLNKNIPRSHLIRLMTSIALATWGHKIGKN